MRRLTGWRALVINRKQKKSQAMLTGKLVAWATALDAEGREVHSHLIERAALTLTPECLLVLADAAPMFDVRQLLAVSGGTGVWRERQHLVAGQAHS
jgi:hypothetical protein